MIDTVDINLVPGGVYMENPRGQPKLYIYTCYFTFGVWVISPLVYMIYGKWARLPKIYRCVYRLYGVIAARSHNNRRETNQVRGDPNWGIWYN